LWFAAVRFLADDVTTVNNHKRSEGSAKLDDEDIRSPRENGNQLSDEFERDARSDRSKDRQPDVVEDHPGKPRSTFSSSHTSNIYAYPFLLVFY